MHIFLDESGSFLPLDGAKERISLVGGLVLPTHSLADIYGEYWELRPRLTFRDGEPKGSAQSEREISSVISILKRHDALLESTCVDAAGHSVKEVRDFQAVQADFIANSPAAKSSAETADVLKRLAQTMAALPPQLFMQCMLYIDVTGRLIRRAPLYYVQRDSRELGVFSWVVDRKNVTLTPMEALWQELILPFIQEEGAQDPMPMLAGADYSYFAKFEMPRPNDQDSTARTSADSTVVNTRALLKDVLRFEDSRAELGLELADIAIAALGRALNGTLGEDGWSELGSLMLYQEPQSLRFIHFTTKKEEQGIQRERVTPMVKVVESLHRRAKSMLSDDNIRAMRRSS